MLAILQVLSSHILLVISILGTADYIIFPLLGKVLRDSTIPEYPILNKQPLPRYYIHTQAVTHFLALFSSHTSYKSCLQRLPLLPQFIFSLISTQAVLACPNCSETGLIRVISTIHDTTQWSLLWSCLACPTESGSLLPSSALRDEALLVFQLPS